MPKTSNARFLWAIVALAAVEIENRFQYARLGQSMNLAQARIGQVVTVERISGEGSFRRRLMELGLVPGTRIELVGVAPLGDPLELLVRGGSLSIRRSEAEGVAVTPGDLTPRRVRPEPRWRFEPQPVQTGSKRAVTP